MEKHIYAVFYRLGSGKEPVREWLFNLSKEDRKIIGEDIKTVEYGWPIGMPTCRPLGEGVYEVRSNITEKRISRVLFTIIGEHMVLLHALIKKTQKTPDSDLKLARRRRKEVLA